MTCPICRKPPAPAYRPFYSKHCADVDLGRWLTGAYAIETPDEPEESALEEPASGDPGSPRTVH
ncbi:MAG: DNA gyrase inhibitor YacG [Planctomycetes bacterium]|nr:DNA gyrase inhibitor YacG [Planctomycetota bacterium]